MAQRKKNLELWLGLLVIVASALTLIGYFWLTGQPLGERGYHLFMVMNSGHGLDRGDRVHVSGVEAGVVRSVTLEEIDRVVVRIWVKRALSLPADTRAVLQSAGFFGEQFVLLQPGTATTLLSDGDTIPAAPAGSLTDVIGDLGSDAEALMVRLNRLLSDPAINDAHGVLSELRSAIGEVQSIAQANSGDLRRLSVSLAKTAETLESTVDGVDIETTLENLEMTAAEMAETAASLKTSAESFESIALKIDRGEGTLGLMVNDSSLYRELVNTTRSIGSLTTDIQLNPSRYLKMAVF